MHTETWVHDCTEYQILNSVKKLIFSKIYIEILYFIIKTFLIKYANRNMAVKRNLI
jgi:hypothetical protein